MKRDNNDPQALGTMIMRHAKLHNCRLTTAADRVYQALAAGTDPLLAPLPEGGSTVLSQHPSAPLIANAADGSSANGTPHRGAQSDTAGGEGEVDFND